MTGFQVTTEVCKGLIAAAVFGCLGLALAYPVVSLAPGKGWHLLIISSGLATFAVGLVLWRRLCAAARATSPRRGALVGALTGLLAHPLAWYFLILFNYLFGGPNSLGDQPLNPLEGLWGCFVFAFWSIFLTGWFTIPAGAITGWLLVRAMRGR